MSVPELRTARLRLRGHRKEDFVAFAAIWADPAVTVWFGGRALSGEEAWKRLLRNVGHWAATGFGFWAIEDAATGALLGESGLMEFHRVLHPAPPAMPECGWILSGAAHGRGLATEAVQAALAWSDQHFGTTDAFCMIDPQNSPSLRVAKKCGFATPTAAMRGDTPVVVLVR